MHTQRLSNRWENMFAGAGSTAAMITSCAIRRRCCRRSAAYRWPEGQGRPATGMVTVTIFTLRAGGDGPCRAGGVVRTGLRRDSRPHTDARRVLAAVVVSLLPVMPPAWPIAPRPARSPSKTAMPTQVALVFPAHPSQRSRACRLLMPVTSWLRHCCDVNLVLARSRLPCGAGWRAGRPRSLGYCRICRWLVDPVFDGLLAWGAEDAAGPGRAFAAIGAPGAFGWLP
jgi:hypothetical protein